MRIGVRMSILAAASAYGMWAQAVAGAGAVSGYVFTGVDDALPQVNVTLTNPALAVERKVLSSDEGFFEFTGVAPAANYKVKIELTGYITWESPAFEVAVGRTQVVTLGMLRTGETAPKGEIFRLVPRVESNKLGIGTWMSPVDVKSLPSSGRVLDSLIALTPMVSIDAVSGRLMFLGETSANNFLHDAISTTNGYFLESRPGMGRPLTLESAQEFQTLAAAYPGEFGRALGGNVNAVTPASPNNFHGGVFDFLRPTTFSSAPRYALGQKLLGQRNQVGGNFGGPLVRDRLMFYVNFEHLNNDFQSMNRITGQNLADPTGKSILASNCTAAAALCSAAIKFISAQMNVVTPLKQHWNGGLARVDYRHSAAHTFTGEFNARNESAPEAALSNLVAANGGLLGLNNATENTRFAKGAWTWTRENEMINEFHAGMWQDRWFNPAFTAGLSTGNVGITVGGITVGNPNPDSRRLNETRYEGVDNFTMTSGTHTLRVGADFSRTHDDVDMLQGTGTYNYGTLTNFAQDFSGGTTRSYVNFAQQFGTSAHPVSYRQLGTYAQDTWRGIPRLNITVGVRWEKTFLPQPSSENTTYYQTGTINSSNVAVSPRVGVAFRANSNTVLRAGYGFFYAPYPGQFIDDLLQGNGISQTWLTVNPNLTNAPIFPKTVTSTTTLTGAANLMFANSKLRNPHNQEATVAIERRIASRTSITLSGVNSRTTKLWTGTDQNIPTPTQSITYPIQNAAGVATGSYVASVNTNRNDSNYHQIWVVGNGGTATYNAISLELQHQVSRSLSAHVDYTWSHAIGTQTGPLYAGAFPLLSNPASIAADKGNLPTDQRSRVFLNLVWQPVITHDNSAVARFFANGWQLSGTASQTSGQPLTPILILNGNQYSGFTMANFTSLNGSGGWARVPFQGIGTMHTDTLRYINARISRTLPFTERIQGLIAFEALNIGNTQRNTSINTLEYAAIATLPANLVNGPYNGVLKPIAGAGAGNASSAYPDGTTARQLQLVFRLTF